MTKSLPASSALKFSQPPLLIEHSLAGEVVPQRPRDGYINATRLCKQAGTSFADYVQSEQAQKFLQALSDIEGLPESELIQVIEYIDDTLVQGHWVHPKVAINLGQLLSPEFAVQVSSWVFDWMEGNVRGHMPEHVQRFMKNRAKIPHTHFSMLNEIYLGLLAPLEDYGIIPPDSMMPDISTGRMFSDFLRSKGIDPSDFPTYQHEFADSSRPPVSARLYPVEYLPEFRRYFNEVWLPERSEKYFGERFPKALPFLPGIRQLPPG